MTKPRDPMKYNDAWFDVLIAAEADQSEIRLSGKRPADVRLTFYSFRSAWESEAKRLREKGLFTESAQALANYRTLCKYRCAITPTAVILIHQAQSDITMETSGETVQSMVDRSPRETEYIRKAPSGKTGPIPTGKQTDLPVASFFDLPIEQKRQAEKKQMEHMIRAGYGTEHEAQYFTKEEWELWTQKPAPEHMLQLFNTAPMGEPNQDAVETALRERHRLMMVGHLVDHVRAEHAKPDEEPQKT